MGYSNPELIKQAKIGEDGISINRIALFVEPDGIVRKRLVTALDIEAFNKLKEMFSRSCRRK